jgi:hypothetical protein
MVNNKEQAMNIKSQIKDALKNAGLGYIKISDGSYNGKTAEPRTLALRGGEIGPLTATRAYVEHCVKVEEKVLATFERLLAHGEWSHTPEASYIMNGATNYTFIVKTGKSTVRVYKFRWESHSTYTRSQGLDPSYKTFWYEMQVEDKKLSDIVMA